MALLPPRFVILSGAGRPYRPAKSKDLRLFLSLFFEEVALYEQWVPQGLDSETWDSEIIP
jgi:hypothetical protein